MSRLRLFFLAIFFVSGCERSGLSPVEIKIDENDGYTPIGADEPQSFGTYVVEEDETLFDIANKYNLDPTNLADINNIKPPYKIRKGQVLRLPNEKSRGSGEKNGETFAFLSPNSQDKDKKDELNDGFAEVIAINSSSGSNNAAASSGQAEILSVPKVTKTVTGKSTAAAPRGAPLIPSISKTTNSQTDRMIYPVDGKIISHFGDVKDGISNDGINFKSSLGGDVKASADGTVIYVGNKLEEDFGNVIIIQHDNDLITSYAHLKDMKVKKDAKVRAGDIIGTVGTSGDVSDPQLHFEVMKNKAPVDPLKYLWADT
jgi:murein DD-endopeptidase MepM/ murein hydrolase activator NlpD